MPAQSPEVVGVISTRSLGGESIFDTEAAITPETVSQFQSEEAHTNRTVAELQQLGFEIYDVNPITISFGGPAKLFRSAFGVKLKKGKAELVEGVAQLDIYEPTGGDAETMLDLPEALSAAAEGLAIATPPQLFVSPIPPIAPVHANAYQYMNVPNDLAVVLRSARVHRLNGTGADVVVAMIDTGHYAHPFFNWHGYRVLPTLLGPGASNPGDDMVGHGTGESANIFAAAPDIRLRPIKGLLDPVGDFNVAASSTPKPQIISNSWGYDVDSMSWNQLKQANLALHNYLKLLEAAVANAVAQDIVVCFSAGNGQRGFPGSHPDVISVGGVHVDFPAIAFEASDYASSFVSQLYPGRRVPDLCGLTGKRAQIGASIRAPSLLLPVQPGADLDKITPTSGANDDGWGLFSGTSAACPQVAGVAALMLQKKPTLSPATIRAKLVSTARDVQAGQSAMGDAAGPGPDNATGGGLVDAKWSYITTFGDVAAEFIAASSDRQLEMIELGQMPRAAEDFISDFIDTLRSR